MNTNYQQATANNFSFLLPAPGNYKEHPDFEKQSLVPNKWGGAVPNDWVGSDKDVK